MVGATSYARVILTLSTAEIAELRRGEDFEEIVAWLGCWRRSAAVDAAYRRLVGALN